jgi:hypothetical protein
MQTDQFLLILRLLVIVLLYLFLMQVVIAITRDLRKTAAASADGGSKATPSAHGHLVVVDSGPSSILPGTRFDLAPQTTVGRGPTNTIQISDNFISAEHTRMWYRNGQWFVQDAGSVNGTFVNNQPALNALPAKNGDIVRVGYIQFKLTS